MIKTEYEIFKRRDEKDRFFIKGYEVVVRTESGHYKTTGFEGSHSECIIYISKRMQGLGHEDSL